MKREKLPDGRLRSTCSRGHIRVVPDKGLGRAALATWESQHQKHEEGSGR